MTMQQPLSFGALLRRHRDVAGLTQEELARKAGLSVPTISNLERGRSQTPYRATVRSLAGALELSGQDRAGLLAAALETAPEPTGNDGPAARTSRPVVEGNFLGALPSKRLVGREAELGRILGALDATMGEAGTGRLVLLAGEAGIGKTRLAQEVSVHAWERGFHVASGRCYEAQGGVAFYPFLEALGTLYEEAPEEARGRWPYLERLLPDHFPSQPAAAPSGSQEELQKLLRAVNGFIRDTATRPVALFIDDLHWADEASLDVLQHLARHTRPDRVLLVGTYRDVEVRRGHPLRKAVRDLNREQLVERVAVGRLGREETSALMSGRLGGMEVSEEFAGLVYAHTGGQPLLRHRGAGGAHPTREPLRVGGALGPQRVGSDRSPRERARHHRRADIPAGAGSSGDAGGGERPGAEVRLRRSTGPLRARRSGGGGGARGDRIGRTSSGHRRRASL